MNLKVLKDSSEIVCYNNSSIPIYVRKSGGRNLFPLLSIQIQYVAPILKCNLSELIIKADRWRRVINYSE